METLLSHNHFPKNKYSHHSYEIIKVMIFISLFHGLLSKLFKYLYILHINTYNKYIKLLVTVLKCLHFLHLHRLSNGLIVKHNKASGHSSIIPNILSDIRMNSWFRCKEGMPSFLTFFLAQNYRIPTKGCSFIST